MNEKIPTWQLLLLGTFSAPICIMLVKEFSIVLYIASLLGDS